MGLGLKCCIMEHGSRAACHSHKSLVLELSDRRRRVSGCQTMIYVQKNVNYLNKYGILRSIGLDPAAITVHRRAKRRFCSSNNNATSTQVTTEFQESPRPNDNNTCTSNVEIDQPKACNRTYLRGLVAVSVVIGTLSDAGWVLSPWYHGSAAHADDWYPRRHHRLLKSQSTTDSLVLKNDRKKKRRKEQEKKTRIQREQQALEDAIQEARVKDDVLLQSMDSLKKIFSPSKEKKASYSVGVSARPPPAAYYGHAIKQRDAPIPYGMGILWGLVGLGVLLFLKNKFGWDFGHLWRKNNGGTSGRWVRDRSLGGRMVFIPDSSTPKAPRPLWDDLPGEEELKKTRSIPGYISDDDDIESSSRQESSKVEKKTIVPVWWAPPAGVSYVSATRKEELQKQAGAILRQLQNKKVELGQDYDLPLLVSLRNTCHNGGGLKVTASTQSGRDSMLRMSVKHSLENPKSSLGGYEPSRFVSGIASDLDVPQDRAITIVHAEIASLCRNSLIDAEAAFRSQDEAMISRSLSRVIHALQSFPIPPGSPEMEMVGRSVMRTTSLEFRKAVFFSAGSIDLSIAPIIAEIVGFDPDLVMPQLLMQIQNVNTQEG